MFSLKYANIFVANRKVFCLDENKVKIYFIIKKRHTTENYIICL